MRNKKWEEKGEEKWNILEKARPLYNNHYDKNHYDKWITFELKNFNPWVEETMEKKKQEKRKRKDPLP